ncbi:MAG: PEGA domain-containing protein [Deltaproteobacteria bacterium]|nr:PEGA domain-containing protein [Deltaproteobacteria bacterium]
MKLNRLHALVLAFLVPARGAAAAEPEAILVLDGAPPDQAAAGRSLRAVAAQVRDSWRVVPATGAIELAMTDATCSAEAAGRTVPPLVSKLREAQHLFFVETAVEDATEALAAALQPLLDHPCLLARLGEARSEAAAGAVLRLHLGEGRPEKAATLARRLALAFPRAEISAVDVPPEVGRFLDGIRSDLESVSTTLTVGAVPATAAGGASLVVDGRKMPGGAPWSVPVPAGTHEVTVLQPGGGAVTRRVVTGDRPTSVEFDLVLAGALVAGPESSLVLLPEPSRPDAPAVCRRVAEVTGRTVLLVRDAGGAASVAAVPPSGAERPDLIRMAPSGDGFDLTVARDAPFLRRAPWPWPWVAAGTAAGALAAAVALNVTANQAARDVNAGANRVSEQRSLKAGAIACYSIAAAGATAAALLWVFRPPPRTTFHVGPTAGGWSLGLAHSF